MEFSGLVGLTLKEIERKDNQDDNGDILVFHTVEGRTFEMYHYQDCCESVSIEDIAGDLDDLIGTPVLLAEESSSGGEESGDYGGSETWTFYRIGTNKGFVTIRWYGASNGYYSESVSFCETTRRT